MLSKYTPDKFSVNVSDFERSFVFYSDMLGFPVLWKNAEAGNAGFKAGNNIIIINLNAERVAMGGFRPHFIVDDLEGLRVQLMEAGIKCTEIEDYHSFEHVGLFDPDGYVIGLLKPKPEYLPRLEGYLERKLFAEA